MMTYIGSNMNRFLETNIINSDKFASASDLIYSQRIGNKLFKNSPSKKIINISNDENFSCTVYKLINFELSENDVIFCNTDYLDNLFFHLNKINELKNLKLVTNQTDQLITKKVFDRKEGWRSMFRLRLTLYIRLGNLFVQDQSARGKPPGPFLHKSARQDPVLNSCLIRDSLQGYQRQEIVFAS